jgi:predicted site-specific integrase-resolvase
MNREPYWDYMGRRMKEERIIYAKDSLEKRIEELERKIALLDETDNETDSRQLELEV